MNSLMNLKNQLMATTESAQQGETVEEPVEVIDAEMGEEEIIKQKLESGFEPDQEENKGCCTRRRCCLISLLGLALVAGSAGFLELYFPGFWVSAYKNALAGMGKNVQPIVEAVQPISDKLEYVTSRCEEGFGAFRVPDDNQVWYCQVCGERPLKAGSLAFGCKNVDSEESHEWDNCGCCLECCKTLGPRMAKSVLMDRDNASFDEDNGDLEKFFAYVSDRDEEGFGVFMCRDDGFYCPLCPHECRKDNMGYKKLAYGCQTNSDSSDDRAWNGYGCCMKCVNEHGSLENAKQELKRFACHHQRVLGQRN